MMGVVSSRATSEDVESLLSNDLRWQLIQRIVASYGFIRSPRLSAFLQFISRLALTGRGDQISEQLIGAKVFDRVSNYDTAVDSIVRAHAVRLRTKLDEYFVMKGALSNCGYAFQRGDTSPSSKAEPALQLRNRLDLICLPQLICLYRPPRRVRKES